MRETEHAAPGLHSNARSALVAFLCLEGVALPLMLWWGRDGWFTVDDWDFLVTREVGNLGDLTRSHFGHFTALPVVAYRGLWSAVGLRSYAPYSGLAIGAHLIVVALLRWVMRRAGTGPWLATLTAILLLFFVRGAGNVLVGFQITFLGALAFGLIHLLFADRDGPLSWRDAAGLLAGAAALMCSGVALVMVGAVGLTTLFRRGWRIAALHIVPLGAIWVSWILSNPQSEEQEQWRATSLATVVDFVGTGVRATFEGLGSPSAVGAVIGLLLVVGLGIRLANDGRRALAGPGTSVLALLAAAIAFLFLTAAARSGPGPEITYFPKADAADRAAIGRYVYIVAALSLPAIGLAAEALARRWRRLILPLAAVLAIGVPGNIIAFADYQPSEYAVASRRQVLGAAHLPIVSQLPHSLPVPGAPHVTVGWLLAARSSGRLPVSPAPTDGETADLTLGLALAPWERASTGPPCQTLQRPVEVVLQKWDRLTVSAAPIDVQLVFPTGRSTPRRLDPLFSPYTALAGPLHLVINPTDRADWSVERDSTSDAPECT